MTQPTAIADTSNKSNILLESGTNELEVLVFTVGETTYGINVAKVREVIQPVAATACPNQPECILGMFNLRGHVLPLVDLHGYLSVEPQNPDTKNWRVIVTDFNGVQSAFRVERVQQIHRMSWSDIRPPSAAGTGAHSAVTGITEIGGQLILMLDFESIVDHIRIQESLHTEVTDNPMNVDRSAYRIFIADDSGFIRSIVSSVLTNCGYTQTRAFADGIEAWEAIEASLENDQLPHLLVTDIEMPRMDGLALTRRIKTDSRLSHIPVILFSSLITEDTRHKGAQVGADDQISKPQTPQMVQLVDQWVTKSVDAQASSSEAESES